MKKVVLIAAVFLTACSGQTGKGSSEADSTSQVVTEEVKSDPYVPVLSASEADVISFVAEGNYSPIQATKSRPQEIWKCKIDASMEKDGMVCRFKVHSEVWEKGADKCKSQFTDNFTGHWTVKATIYGRGTIDWYYYTGVNDKGDKFSFRVLTSFKKGNSETRGYPMNFDISNVEMKKLKTE